MFGDILINLSHVESYLKIVKFKYKRCVFKVRNTEITKPCLAIIEIKLVKNAQSAAGFFAAKEAVSKALRLGISKECGFFDIKIYKLPNGAPSFTLSPHLVKSYKITSLSLSISHDGGFAIAIAVIEGRLSQKQKLSH